MTEEEFAQVFYQQTRSPSKFSLHDFLSAAFEYNSRVLSSLEHGDAFRSVTWEFCRWAKSHEEMSQLSAYEANARVERWILSCGYKSIETGWRDMFSVDSAEDAQMDFLNCWDAIRFSAGATPVQLALMMADARPLFQHESGPAGFRRFLSFSARLQIVMADRNILLPCEKLAIHFECKSMTISRYRTLAIKRGFLKIVVQHSHIKREATEFRFCMEKLPANSKVRLECLSNA